MEAGFAKAVRLAAPATAAIKHPLGRLGDKSISPPGTDGKVIEAGGMVITVVSGKH